MAVRDMLKEIAAEAKVRMWSIYEYRMFIVRQFCYAAQDRHKYSPI